MRYIKGIDTSEAEKMPGVEKVITWKDVKGKNAITGLITFPTNKGDGWDRPILCKDKIFQFGDAIAIVAADTEEHARAAADKVKVDLEVLPAYMSGFAALAPDAMEIHPGVPNAYYEQGVVKGADTKPLFEKAKASVDITTYCSRQPHLHLEPDCGVAYIDDDGVVTIQSKSIGVHLHHAMICPGIGIEPEKLRLIQNPTGGTFGYKFSPTMEALLGVAALATGKPVSLVYNQFQNITYTGKRSPGNVNIKLACDANGKLTAMETDWWIDHGPYSEFGDLLTIRQAQFTGAGYHLENIRGHGRTVATNHAWGSAFRAYGSPQSFLASEIAIDMLAEKMGEDPFEFRYKNLYNETSTTPTGQKPDVLVLRQALRHAASEVPGGQEALRRTLHAGEEARRRHRAGHLRLRSRRTGQFGGARRTDADRRHRLQLLGRPRPGRRSRHADHGARGAAGGRDQAGADQAGDERHQPAELRPGGRQPLQRVHRQRHARRGGNAVERDAQAGRHVSHLRRDGAPRRSRSPTTASGWRRPARRAARKPGRAIPFPVYMYEVFMPEVEVDMESGEAKVVKFTTAVDVGTIINRATVDGQIYGGLAQGIGLALTEDFEDLELHTTLRDCGIPYPKDIPDDMEILYLETPRPLGPFGAAGVGEAPLTAPHPAILNAIYNACGVRIFRVPALADVIKLELDAKKARQAPKHAEHV